MAIVVNLCVSFLLLQITAAEQKESYCYTLSRILPCMDSPYRNIDGSCNNLKHPSWGKSYWPYRRLLPNRYANGKHELPKQKSGKAYPSPRVVSNTLMPVGDQKSKKYNTMQMSMGQIITHDLGLAAGTQVGVNGNLPPPGCCTNNKYGILSNTSKCTDIPIPPGDPDYSEPGYACLPFARTSTTKKYLCALFQKAEEQITEVTSYMDMSLVYGSTDQKMRELRTFSDGKLKSVMRDGQEFPPNVAMPPLVCVRATKPDVPCYNSGDERMNQNPPLTTLQVAWLRQHNKLATALISLNPQYSDEKNYQEARRINIAMLQNIAFSEVLQDYLGLENMVDAGLYFPNATGCVNDYDETLDATTHQEFATGAWRLFHSLIQGRFSSYNNKREFTQNIYLADYIDSGSALEKSDEVNYNTFLRGMTIENDYLSDEYYEHSLKYQFAKNDQTGYGLDLISIDIQRERDHGLGSYCDAREYCKNPCPETFEELVPLISKENVEKMKTMYETVYDIELYSGGILEENVPGSLAGPTFLCIIIDQFTRTRRGDRYFFENCEPHGFTEEQLKSIRSVTLARILCDNSDIDQCQPRATQIPGDDNQLINCTDLPYLNITLFRSKDSNIEYNDTFLEGIYRAFTKIVDKIKPSYVG